MKTRTFLLIFLGLFCPWLAGAHIGSSDVFYDGKVGNWPARITIRMPVVVPGQAEIIAQVQSDEPVTVSYTPLSSRTAITNAPPADVAQPVRGETNVFTGQLWLMSFGAYSIEVKILGKSGEGSVLIPVNSSATAQLPLPPALGGILAVLGIILCVGAMAIVGAAAGESTLVAGEMIDQRRRRKYWIAASVTGIVLAVGLVGGRKWWGVEEGNFRTHLRAGGWPDLSATVRQEGMQRILQLSLGKTNLDSKRLDLTPDHGKILHLFLVSLPDHEAFAHIHPVRHGGKTFEVALPPLPEGDYEMFCDLTLESGISSTATNVVHVPAITTSDTGMEAKVYLEPDPDDSWATNSAVAMRESSNGDTICRLPDGTQVIWKAHAPLQVQHDAGLQFDVKDATGQPASLEPYMGMLSHAAIMRLDGQVFSHLHPTGNFSMAAQMFFNAKMAREMRTTEDSPSSATNAEKMMVMPDGTVMKASDMSMGMGSENSSITLPYQFPSAGNYRIWVQVKIGGQVKTAIFDATVK